MNKKWAMWQQMSLAIFPVDPFAGAPCKSSELRPPRFVFFPTEASYAELGKPLDPQAQEITSHRVS